MTNACKDIPDLPVLRFLESLGSRWANWFGNQYDNSVTLAMPEGIPPKLARAKMAQLIKRGLVNGCSCGCRGDYTLTDKGRSFLGAQCKAQDR